MGVFRQLGDPVCPPCLCQHHEAAYAEYNPTGEGDYYMLQSGGFAVGAAIVQQAIIITERCCVAVNAATIVPYVLPTTSIEIERPLGSIRTTQESGVLTSELHLHHHAAWEVLDPGTYTYFLVNRHNLAISVFGAWLKIIASDCEG